MLKFIQDNYYALDAFTKDVNELLANHPGSHIVNVESRTLDDETIDCTAWIDVPAILPKTKTDVSLNDLAYEILDIVHRHEVYVNPVQLQNILFLTYKDLLEHADEAQSEILANWYQDPFLVWYQGPMVLSLYEDLRIHNNSGIVLQTHHDPYFDDFNLDEIVSDLLTKPSRDQAILVQENPFWRANLNQIKGWRSDVAFSIQDILAK